MVPKPPQGLYRLVFQEILSSRCGSWVREYLEVASIRRYVILEQDSIAASVFERDRDVWQATVLTGEDMLTMPEIGIVVPLAECYAGVAFPENPSESSDAV